MKSREAASSIRWHRRLSVRLALLLTAMAIGFDLLQSALHDPLFALLNFPEPGAEVYYRDDSWIRRGLLTGAERERAGRYLPTVAAVEDLGTDLAEDGVAFLWLDDQGEVLCASERLPWPEGSHWEVTPAATLRVPLPGRAEPAPTVCQELFVDGELAGIFVQIVVDLAAQAEVYGVETAALSQLESWEFSELGGFGYMSREAMERAGDDEQRVVTLLAFAVMAVIAILASVVVSRRVTAPLARLAARAGGNPLSDDELPGPFDEGGAHEVAALARSMNAMRGRVEELVQGLADRDRARREWIAQVSHDLRTPLTALLACLDRSETVLAGDSPESVAERMRELVAVARMDADRVRVLADDLLDIARLDASDELDLEPVPPGELVRTTLQALGPLAEVHGVRLQSEVEANMPILTADGGRLMRALENLVRNAIQHAAGAVTAVVTSTASGVRVEIRDDGPGLPCDPDAGAVGDDVSLESLAQSRSRADSAGLGLLVARKVLDAHGGTIGARNRAEGGATVWFELPLGAD
ncbi:MAG: HAMP domain-containing sensor histidine kinase [Planctomycetota bacterium]